jgi:hypothetical protein
MVHYCHSDQIGAARAKYFSVNGFGSDGGYNARWVKVMVGAVPIYFPNTTSRVRAVRLHDLHHIVTEYETYLVGEAEIEAWEIASGCGLYIAAWVLNLSAVAIGLFVAPQGSLPRSNGVGVRATCTRKATRNPFCKKLSVTFVSASESPTGHN